MSLRHPARAGLPAMLLGLLALAGTADLAAAQAGTSCRGSGARATAPGVADSEPVVANSAADPCVTDSAESVTTTPQNGLTAVNPKADTVRTAGIVGASASVDSVSGTVGGAVPIAVGAVSSQQTVTCVGGSPVAGGSSRVESLSIGGTAIPRSSAARRSTSPCRLPRARSACGPTSSRARPARALDPRPPRRGAERLRRGHRRRQRLPAAARLRRHAARAAPAAAAARRRATPVCPKGSEYVVARQPLRDPRRGRRRARPDDRRRAALRGPERRLGHPAVRRAQALRHQALPERLGAEVRDRRHEQGRPDHRHERARPHPHARRQRPRRRRARRRLPRRRQGPRHPVRRARPRPRLRDDRATTRSTAAARPTA